MKIEESYSLYMCAVTNGKKKLSVYDMSGIPIKAVYTNLRTGITNTKDISFERYSQFLDKHRGKRTRGYNNPVIVTITRNEGEKNNGF